MLNFTHTPQYFSLQSPFRSQDSEHNSQGGFQTDASSKPIKYRIQERKPITERISRISLKSRLSKTLSKAHSKLLSKTLSKTPSKTFSKTLSKTHSKTLSKTLSKIPKEIWRKIRSLHAGLFHTI